ncbi:hypothetical protein BG454_17720 [Roseinatronobacter bogoriensis subsp. barguzinensis]|uniref:Uncharacterized protein n=2 Tax=Roseinatronobacter bogoriensis TaxID=119542 RepID=A0A2K8KLL7_9RHOB|nr:hypothetical protein BG454_17720 [Rhodobaca barguzinensis]
MKPGAQALVRYQQKEDTMSMTSTNHPQPARPSLRKHGVISLWGRVRYRQPGAYDAWLRERDMTIITANLMRLSEGQLNRLGLSHKTLALDVEDLALRAQRNAEITREVLELVEDDTPQSHAIAAE